MEADPNVIIASLIASFVAGIAGWVWGKIKGTKQREAKDVWRELVNAALVLELDEALDQRLSTVATRYKLEDAAWEVLERLGLKRSNKIAAALVRELVQSAVTEFRRRLKNEAAAKRLPRELEEMQQSTVAMRDQFEKLEKAHDALHNSPNVEIVKPDGSETFKKWGE